MFEIISEKGEHNFAVLRNGIEVCSLEKKPWFQGSAKGRANNEIINFVPAGLFQDKYNILKNGKPCGYIKLRWTGHASIILERADGNEADIFDLKVKNWLGVSYQLFEERGALILRFEGHFVWKSLSYKFEIKEGQHSYLDQEIDELLLYSVFAKKLHLKKQSHLTL